MEIILTVEAGDGSTGRISATATNYAEALAAAEAKIPEGSKALVIRVA